MTGGALLFFYTLYNKLKGVTTMIGIIVEGPYDEKVVKQAVPEVEVLILNGNGFRHNADKINQLVKQCELVFILTDPDHAGTLIADKILRAFPETYRIYVDPKLACKKIYKKFHYGIEYCEIDYVRELIISSVNSRLLYNNTEGWWTRNDHHTGKNFS